MNILDSLTFGPWEELTYACSRAPSEEYSNICSLKGRAVCVFKIFYHAAGIIIKPLVYIGAGSLGILIIVTAKVCKVALDGNQPYYEQNPDLFEKQLFTFIYFISCGFVAPLGQAIQIGKAALGILYPGFYFKEDELAVYFHQLSNIAASVGCQPSFVALLNDGSSIIDKGLKMSPAQSYYYSLYKRDFGLICEKLTDPAVPNQKKLALLNMLDPEDHDDTPTGLHSCPPGLGRILEQMCASLNVPSEPEKIYPWLVAQYKEELLNKMIMQTIGSNDNDDLPHWQAALKLHKKDGSNKTDSLHLANALVLTLGDALGFPQEMIDYAKADVVTNFYPIPPADRDDIIKAFFEMYSEDELVQFIITNMNSQSDGTPGLAQFRMHVIQKLTESISDDNLEASKEDVIQKFGVSDALADDPSLYVKLHYYLYPDADPSDEKHTDINEAGIKAFIALHNS